MLRKAFRKLMEGRQGAESPTSPAKAADSQVILAVDRALVERQALALARRPQFSEPRKPRVIVSLTSYPARIEDAFYAIVSLLRQSMTPEFLLLWLAEEQFPRKERDVPERIQALCQFGLTIRWCEDLRSYKKLVPALREFPEDIIVTADDDIYYPYLWLEMLYQAHRSEPNSIHAHRVHRCRLEAGGLPAPYASWEKSIPGGESSALNFATGCGGVLYPPHSLHPEVTRAGIFTDLCPTADDVWFWFNAVRNRTKTRAIEGGFASLIYVDAEQEMGLKPGTTLYEVNRTANDAQIGKVLSKLDRESLRMLCSAG